MSALLNHHPHQVWPDILRFKLEIQMKTWEHARQRHPGLIPILVLLFSAGPVVAIDFSPLPQAFVETFTGETSSPTTPEIDRLGTSGLDVDGTLTGTAAHLTLGPSDINSITQFDLVDTESVSTHGSDYGLRAEFENLSFAFDGSADLIFGAAFRSVGPGSRSGIRVGLNVITDFGGNHLATLIIDELSGPNLSTLIGTDSHSLTTAEATAIVLGAQVRLELFIDDSSSSVSVDIEINGVLSSAPGFLNLGDYDQQSLEFAFFGLTNFLFVTDQPPTSVDLTLVEVYADVEPLMFEPLFNIDISGAFGVPSSNYAAAGGAGEWNRFLNLGGRLLVDVNNLTTGATATLSSATIDNLGLPFPDVTALLGDSTSDCNDPDEWSLDFTGLPDGVYKIIAYAPTQSDRQTGDISIDGQLAIDSLPGDLAGALVEEFSWDTTLAVVSGGGGTLSIDGLGNGAVACAGIAGIQIEFEAPIVVAPTVPSLGPPALLGLVGLLLVLLCSNSVRKRPDSIVRACRRY